MIICNICGAEKSDGRQMHGHFMKSHLEEYEKNNFDLEKVTTGYKRKPKRDYTQTEKKETNTETARPIHLRLIDKNDVHELEAYELGYRYYDISTDMAYTPEEIKAKGWL